MAVLFGVSESEYFACWTCCLPSQWRPSAVYVTHFCGLHKYSCSHIACPLYRPQLASIVSGHATPALSLYIHGKYEENL